VNIRTHQRWAFQREVKMSGMDGKLRKKAGTIYEAPGKGLRKSLE
jgi:hypothetical protein